MSANSNLSSAMDYLNSPPKRYTRMGSALIESPTGEYVRFADMDLYMFEGGQLLQQAAAKLAKMKEQLGMINALENTPHMDAKTKVAVMAAMARAGLS